MKYIAMIALALAGNFLIDHSYIVFGTLAIFVCGCMAGYQDAKKEFSLGNHLRKATKRQGK